MQNVNFFVSPSTLSSPLPSHETSSECVGHYICSLLWHDYAQSNSQRIPSTATLCSGFHSLLLLLLLLSKTPTQSCFQQEYLWDFLSYHPELVRGLKKWAMKKRCNLRIHFKINIFTFTITQFETWCEFLWTTVILNEQQFIWMYTYLKYYQGVL